MIDAETKNRPTPAAPSGGGDVTARSDDAAAAYNAEDIQQRLYDYVMGRVTLSGMQAEVAVALLKQTRSATAPVATSARKRRAGKQRP